MRETALELEATDTSLLSSGTAEVDVASPMDKFDTALAVVDRVNRGCLDGVKTMSEVRDRFRESGLRLAVTMIVVWGRGDSLRLRGDGTILPLPFPLLLVELRRLCSGLIGSSFSMTTGSWSLVREYSRDGERRILQRNQRLAISHTERSPD